MRRCEVLGNPFLGGAAVAPHFKPRTTQPRSPSFVSIRLQIVDNNTQQRFGTNCTHRTYFLAMLEVAINSTLEIHHPSTKPARSPNGTLGRSATGKRGAIKGMGLIRRGGFGATQRYGLGGVGKVVMIKCARKLMGLDRQPERIGPGRRNSQVLLREWWMCNFQCQGSTRTIRKTAANVTRSNE